MATEIDIAVTTTTYDVTITATPNEYIVNITTGGVATTPTLQQVTDEGFTTTNPIVSEQGLQGSEVNATDGVKIVALSADGLAVRFNNGTQEGLLSANGLDGNYSWALPNADGTIALTSDIPTTTATTGAVISFATPQIYNSIASPSSSNITDNLTGARIGVVQKIYHNAGTEPTVPAGWVRRGTGTYVTSTLNIIYAEWSVGTTVEYWITQ